jgi:hypothetical protein
MGIIKKDNFIQGKDYSYFYYVSDNGLKYELLEGITIGGANSCTSDICFILLDTYDDPRLLENEDDRTVGWFYGAIDIKNDYDTEKIIKYYVDIYEKNHPDIVELYKGVSK